VTPAGVVGLQFRNEVETVNALVPVLKEKGVTVFVVLLHQGASSKAKMAMDKSCPGVTGESLDLVDRMDPAIDVVVNGHTHQEYVCFRPDGKLMTQAGFYGRMVTKIDLTVDRRTRKVIAKDANNKVVVNDLGVKDASGKAIPLPAGYSALQPDPATNKLVQRYGALAASMSEVVLGSLAAPLDRRANSAGESTLGNFIADAFLASTSGAAYGGKPSQIAFMNRGGLRSDLSTSLSVSHGHLFNVMPFNDVVVAMDLTGQQLLRLLEQQWESPQPAGGRIMSVSNGFTYSWDASAPERAPSGGGQRIVPGSMKLNGESIEMERVYRVTVNNFMSVGGDNYSILSKGANRQDGEIDLIVVKRYFERQGVIKPPELGRIVRAN
jgi:5'-nucleotidase